MFEKWDEQTTDARIRIRVGSTDLYTIIPFMVMLTKDAKARENEFWEQVKRKEVLARGKVL